MFGGYEIKEYFCTQNDFERLNDLHMNTITINSVAYQGAEMYAKLHHISVEAVFEKGIELLLGKLRSCQTAEKDIEYYISPKVKALETGFKCPEHLSSDYKQELSGLLVDRYL